jgi:methyl coenzyme M reductase subunit D
MAYNNAYEYLIADFTKQQETVGAQLMNGRISSMEEYRRLCGLIQGLEYAKETVKDLHKRQENDADE